MKKIIFNLSLFGLVLFAIPQLGFAQQNSQDEIWFDIMRVYPKPTLERDKLTAAKKIVDIHKYFKPSWVREYKSVEVITTIEGITKNAISKTNILSEEQKYNMEMADVGSEISVFVHYIPENTLKNNEQKVYDFSFYIDAETEASPVEGKVQFLQYLKENVIKKIDQNLFDENYIIASVNFAIDSDGKITESHISNSSKDKSVDTLLLNAVCNMSPWKPAEYANSKKTKQEFVLAIGDRQSCMMNLLNLKDTRKVEE